MFLHGLLTVLPPCFRGLFRTVTRGEAMLLVKPRPLGRDTTPSPSNGQRSQGAFSPDDRVVTPDRCEKVGRRE